MLRQKTRKTSKKQCEILYKCKRWSELRQKDDTKVHFNLCAEISTNRWAMQSKLKRIWLKCLQRGCEGGEKGAKGCAGGSARNVWLQMEPVSSALRNTTNTIPDFVYKNYL